MCSLINVTRKFGSEYVKSVMNGEKPANNLIGRELIKMVNQVPKLAPEQFEEMLNSNIKASLIFLRELPAIGYIHHYRCS